MVVNITLHICGTSLKRTQEMEREDLFTSCLITFSYMINYFIMGIILLPYKVFIKVLNRKHHKVFLTIISQQVAFIDHLSLLHRT